MEEMLKLLAAGGDVGTYALLFFFWRLEKRVSLLEFRNNVS